MDGHYWNVEVPKNVITTLNDDLPDRALYGPPQFDALTIGCSNEVLFKYLRLNVKQHWVDAVVALTLVANKVGNSLVVEGRTCVYD